MNENGSRVMWIRPYLDYYENFFKVLKTVILSILSQFNHFIQRKGLTLAVIKSDRGHLRLTFSFPCIFYLLHSVCEVLSEGHFQKRHKSKMTCLQSPRHLVCQFRFFTNIPKITTFVNWSERNSILWNFLISSDSWDDPGWSIKNLF